MMESEIRVLEELFAEQNFELSDEKSVIQENLEIAEEMHSKAVADVEQLAKCLKDGVCFDVYAAILSVQILGISERAIKRFEGMI